MLFYWILNCLSKHFECPQKSFYVPSVIGVFGQTGKVNEFEDGVLKSLFFELHLYLFLNCFPRAEKVLRVDSCVKNVKCNFG